MEIFVLNYVFPFAMLIIFSVEIKIHKSKTYFHLESVDRVASVVYRLNSALEFYFTHFERNFNNHNNTSLIIVIYLHSYSLPVNRFCI